MKKTSLIFYFLLFFISPYSAFSAIAFVDLDSCSDPRWAHESQTKDVTPYIASSFCAAQPKAWTSEEKTKIRRAFLKIQTLKNGKNLIDKITHEMGPLYLYRGSGHKNSLGITGKYSNTIYIYDRRFDLQKKKYDSTLEKFLVHEMVHIFDCLPSNLKNGDCLSQLDSTQKKMNFIKHTMKTSSNRTKSKYAPKNFSFSEYDKIEAQASALQKAGQIRKGIELERAYAHSLRLPSFYTLDAGPEAFAELMAFFIIEHNSHDLHENTARWFQKLLN